MHSAFHHVQSSLRGRARPLPSCGFCRARPLTLLLPTRRSGGVGAAAEKGAMGDPARLPLGSQRSRPSPIPLLSQVTLARGPDLFNPVFLPCRGPVRKILAISMRKEGRFDVSYIGSPKLYSLGMQNPEQHPWLRNRNHSTDTLIFQKNLPWSWLSHFFLFPAQIEGNDWSNRIPALS